MVVDYKQGCGLNTLFVDGCIVEFLEVLCLFNRRPKSGGADVGLKINCTVQFCLVWIDCEFLVCLVKCFWNVHTIHCVNSVMLTV
jgi:hypothetical protein